MKINEPVNVVVADDESLVLDLIEQTLEWIGMKIVGRAANGRQAVELTRALRPGVVLMDIAMPVMDGLAAAAAIQAECPTPVVILSAHETRVDVAQATAAGVGAFLVKPSKAAEIERAITIAMARHADLMDLRRLNRELTQALAEVKVLRGFLPICCYCKKIRDDQGYWDEVEVYVMKHSDAQFTHSYCPKCVAKHFPDYAPPVEG
ncbi:MAG: response regulator transcription factor [Opitutae bacterium]